MNLISFLSSEIRFKEKNCWRMRLFGKKWKWQGSEIDLRNLRTWRHLQVFLMELVSKKSSKLVKSKNLLNPLTPTPSFFLMEVVSKKKFQLGKIKKSVQPKCRTTFDTTSEFFWWRWCPRKVQSWLNSKTFSAQMWHHL